MNNPISGFYKKSKEEKISWLRKHYFQDDAQILAILESYWHTDEAIQALHDDFIENTVSNFYLPIGIAPNFNINGELLAVPMAIEESSVVAAAANSAKFWLSRGGFHAKVVSSTKSGQVHLSYSGEKQALFDFFKLNKDLLIQSIASIQKNMKARGGGLLDIELIDSTDKLADYYQINASFETLDAMGANFINSCLESIADTLENLALEYPGFQNQNNYPFVEMSILSNYVPECLVVAEVKCKVTDLAYGDLSGEEFARRLIRAVDIAKAEPKRAVTHNKGIMNGVDAVVIATGNDFRAVEAGVHAYACKDGNYTSLTHAEIKGDQFRFWIELPLALGTVGGLTSLHPMVKFSLGLLDNPNAKKLMKVTAVAGLAQNFAALRSLVTTGIQKGHMRMHLGNILNQLNASETQKHAADLYFKDKTISVKAVKEYIESL